MTGPSRRPGPKCDEGALRRAERDEGALHRIPVLRVVRGEPDDAELAALTAVVAGLASAGGPPAEPARRSAWSDRRAHVRAPLAHGPGAWRASGLPG